MGANFFPQLYMWYYWILLSSFSYLIYRTMQSHNNFDEQNLNLLSTEK